MDTLAINGGARRKRHQAFAVLGLDATASAEEVRAAYRKLALKHHPDRGGDKTEFQRVQAAYETASAYCAGQT
jgi:DnaJ family protein A protein 2